MNKTRITIILIACAVILICSVYKSSTKRECMTTNTEDGVLNELAESQENVDNLQKELDAKEKELLEIGTKKTNLEKEQVNLWTVLAEKQTLQIDDNNKPSTFESRVNSKKLDFEIYELELQIKSISDQITQHTTNMNNLKNDIYSLRTNIDARKSNKSPVPEVDATDVAIVQNKEGKMVGLESTGTIGGSPTYYTPGSYTFGASTYVPSYEDSVMLSKTSGNYTAANYLNESSLMKGSCEYYKDQPAKLEQACLNVDKKNCSSMSCCVLLGGSKCVSGDANGPTSKLNYGDKNVKNKDYYYHSGKCYGNCN